MFFDEIIKKTLNLVAVPVQKRKPKSKGKKKKCRSMGECLTKKYAHESKSHRKMAAKSRRINRH